MECHLKDLSIPVCLQKAKTVTNKYWNERKRTRRLEKSNATQKVDLKRLKKEKYRLQQEFERSQKAIKVLEEDAKIVIDVFQQ
jgi:uncharacterized protein YlxW (UPF0749 family)